MIGCTIQSENWLCLYETRPPKEPNGWSSFSLRMCILRYLPSLYAPLILNATEDVNRQGASCEVKPLQRSGQTNRRILKTAAGCCCGWRMVMQKPVVFTVGPFGNTWNTNHQRITRVVTLELHWKMMFQYTIPDFLFHHYSTSFDIWAWRPNCIPPNSKYMVKRKRQTVVVSRNGWEMVEGKTCRIPLASGWTQWFPVHTVCWWKINLLTHDWFPDITIIYNH